MKLIHFIKNRKKLVIAILVAAILLFLFMQSKGTPDVQEQATVERGTVQEELILSGELKASQSSSLQFGSSGTLSWVNVKSGDWVKKGQALAKLDTVQLNASYQQALANLRLAEATVARVYDSLKDKGASESFAEKETRVTAEVAKDKAYEAFVSAQKALRDATLLSPFEGLVTSVLHETAGVMVTAGTPQVKVVNPKSLYFSVNADQTDVSHFKPGDKAVVILDAFDGEELTGVISSISFSPSESESGTVYPMRLTLTVDNSSYKYKEGMTGDARFVLSEKKDTLWVPSSYIKSDREGKYVFVEDGKTKKYVTLGIEGEDRVEISGDGITQGLVVFD